MRLIDADALKDRLDYCVKEGMGSTIAFTFKHMVDDAPTIEPKRGKWIRDTSSPIAYKCTACNTLQHWSVIQDGRYHFCPNCGAQMKGADDDTI